MPEALQRAISIPEPTNNVDSLWSSVKALKEAVEMIQGIRGNREYALLADVLTKANDLEQQILAIDISAPATVGLQGLGVWKYRTETGTPPNSGQIRFDNANITAATEFYLHETNAEGTDVANFLELLLQDGAVLYIQDKTNSNNHVLIDINSSTDNGTWRTYGIQSVIEVGTEPSQNTDVILFSGGAASSGGGLSASADEVITGDWEFQTDVSVNEALTIFNPDATSGLKWGFGAGEPGINDDDLLLSSDVSAFGANIEVAFRRGAAAAFSQSVAVGNNQSFQSLTSGALAYYMPYDATGTHQAILSFRSDSGSGQASQFSIESYNYGDSGLQLHRVVYHRVDADYTIHSDFQGDVNVANALTATTYGGIPEASLVSKTADEAITGDWTIDDPQSAAQPLGYNTMPIYEIDANDIFDTAHQGMIWHKDAGGAISFTCDNVAGIDQGATWIVHNDDTEPLTIAEGAGVTIEFLLPGGIPGTGDVVIEQGGIVTVYKYTDTVYWCWGSIEPGSIVGELSDLTDVTSAAITNRFALLADGANYVGRAILEADISDLQAYSLTSHIHSGLYGDLSADEAITGDWIIDDPQSAAQPLGYNTMPIYEIDANDVFDTAHQGMIWHKDAGGAIAFTCDNVGGIDQGATWIVHNDDTEDLTIAEGSGVTIRFLEPGAAPVTGDVLIAQGGIVTVYKYTNTEYWCWGAIAVSGTAPVDSVFGRIGAVVAGTGDYSAFYPQISQAETITGLWTFNTLSNAASRLTLGEAAALRGDSQEGMLDLYGEFTSTIYGARVAVIDAGLHITGIGGNPVTSLQLDLSLGLEPGNQIFITDGNILLHRAAGGEMLTLKDSGGSGSAADPHIAFLDSGFTRQGYVGVFNTGNQDMYLVADIGDVQITAGGGQIRLNDQTILNAGADFQDAALVRAHMDDFAILHQVVAGVTSTTISYSSGQSVLLNLSTNDITTLTINDWPATGRLGQMEFEITQGAATHTIAWDTLISGTVDWPGGVEPDLNVANGTILVQLRSRDGKTTLIGTYAENLS